MSWRRMGERRYTPPFLTSALDGSKRSASRSARINPKGKRSRYPFTGGWVSLRARLDVVKRKIFYLFRDSNSGRPACSPSDMSCLWKEKLWSKRSFASKETQLSHGWVTEKGCFVVALDSHIREVLRLNFDRDTGDPQFLESNSRTVPGVGHDGLLPSFSLPFEAVQWGGVHWCALLMQMRSYLGSVTT
jgi:hypothetical protein